MTNLTAAQLLVWAGQQIHPDHRQYSELALFHIHGAVDPPRFCRALDAVVDESDALRTVVRVDGAWPRQEVVSRRGPAAEVVDLGGGPDARARLDAWLAGWTAAPFAAEAAPHRSALLALAPDHFVWAFHQHQLVGDAWSVALVFQAVRERYVAPDATPRRPRPQYAEYVAWERRYRESAAGRRAAAYWAAALARPPEPLRFYERRGMGAAHAVHRLSCRLAEETPAIDALASRFTGGATDLDVCSVFGAATAIYVARICGVRSCTLGVPYASRGSRRFKDTIGSFMHICPLRIAIDPDASVRELAGRVRAEAIAVGRHQQLAVRNPVRGRHYEVVVNYQKPVAVDLEFAGRPVRVEWPTLGYGNHALTVQITRYDAARTIELALDLNADAFAAPYRARALEHYRATVRSILAAPDDPIGTLPLVSDDERRVLRTISVGRRVALPPDTLPGLVARAARRHPDRLALVEEGRAVTCRWLDGTADRIAARLRASGVGRATIGTVLERDVRGWATILGILKSGAAYLPLDRRHPAARLRQIVALAGCRHVVVADPAVADAFAPLPGLRCTPARALIDGDDGAQDAPPVGAPSGRDRFYVIFTSGSTGAPKGIVIEHRGMANHAQAKVEALGMHEGDRVAQTAPMTFDVSVWQVFASLSVGAEVHLLDDEVARDPHRLVAEWERRRITIAATVPSMLAAILDAVEGGSVRRDLTAMRWLVVTGEVLAPELCRRWLALHPGVPLLNAYGPSECSDDVTHHAVRAAPPAVVGRVPIGRPIRNMAVWVLDEHRRPAPVGVPGELWIGGVGVGRGYLDAASTAEAFVDGACPVLTPARLYRSGDVGWYRADGVLELTGRRDDLTKIRGHRVEPGEVAAVLHDHPGVADAVVVGIARPPGPTRLVAYVVPKTAAARSESRPAPVSVVEVHAFLRTRVPEVMVPAHVVLLDRLPLTAHGKVDRSALPAPARGGSTGALPSRPPRTAVEATVAAVWQEVLGVDAIGADDDLFTLGGDSLLAARIAGCLRQQLLVDVPVSLVLERSTVATLAAALEAAAARAGSEREGAALAAALAEVESMSDEEAEAAVGDDA